MTALRLTGTLLVALSCIAGCATSPSDKKPTPAQPVADSPPTTTDAPAEWCAGRPVEVLEEYWDDGSPSVREEVVVDDDGEYVRHGQTTHWYQNGQKKLEIRFNCGLRHGKKEAWYADGAPWSVGYFVNDRDDGTWTVWHPDGTKAREYNMREGAWHGPFATWHPNGQPQLKGEYVAGLQQGVWVMWDEQGNVLKQAEYIDGKEQPLP
ncbi:MAG: toxin-antitoxin system YwqK family antitoxin [Planctomycetes bacterium]|nr:toxin-antitoxin system YwqK family antitoxin [Planctomycetota bacterium]